MLRPWIVVLFPSGPTRTFHRTNGPAAMTLAEIMWDGQTVWVNGIDGLLGRFHPRRMDVHADNRCERCGPGTWEEFVAAMKEIHGVEVPPDAAPQSGRRP